MIIQKRKQKNKSMFGFSSFNRLFMVKQLTMEAQVKPQKKKRNVIQLTESEITNAISMVVSKILAHKGVLRKKNPTGIKRPVE